MALNANGIDCAADKLELALMPDHSVHVIIRCGNAYEAGVLFEDIGEVARKGTLALNFVVTKVTEEI